MKFDIPTFGGEEIGKEPDEFFFERLADMPPQEAEEELRAAKAWALYQIAECDRIGGGHYGNSYRALVTKLNGHLHMLAQKNRHRLLRDVIEDLLGRDTLDSILVELAAREAAERREV
jgi:hypothetical protein